MKLRHDQIPILVETAKGYMSHERETLEAVISAHNMAKSARKASRKLESFDSLTLDHLKWG